MARNKTPLCGFNQVQSLVSGQKKHNILLWFLVNEVKSTCFQTWVKILSGWNKNGSEKVSAGEYCHPAAPNIASHASPRRRFRDQLCHPCHLLFRARNLIGHLFGATNGYRGGSSDFRRFFRFTHVHPESGVHLFIAILSSKDTWLLRKIENLSNTNAQNGRSKRREFQDLINKRAGISNKINKDEDLFHQQPCVFHLYQWYTNDQ